MSHASRNAHIQSLYREVNEGIALMGEGWETPLLELLCECGTARCSERIEMAPADYELLRSDATHFALRPGHEDDTVEQVVLSTPDYLIVANHGRAATVARRRDPRAAR